MILYFSGTENSEYIANNLRKILVDDAVDLFHFIKNGEKQTFESEKTFCARLPDLQLARAEIFVGVFAKMRI